jgi:hypothetical protein
MTASNPRLRRWSKAEDHLAGNCRGCHVVNRRGRAIGALISDTNFTAGPFATDGRAQSPWLFSS